MTALTPDEIAKLRWANSHPHVKIDDFDTVGDSLHDRGYLQHHDAGYVDWYGYWVTIPPKGYKALLLAEAGAPQGIEARSAETLGSAEGESPVSRKADAPDPNSPSPQPNHQESAA